MQPKVCNSLPQAPRAFSIPELSRKPFDQSNWLSEVVAGSRHGRDGVVRLRYRYHIVGRKSPKMFARAGLIQHSPYFSLPLHLARESKSYPMKL